MVISMECGVLCGGEEEVVVGRNIRAMAPLIKSVGDTRSNGVNQGG